MDLLFSSVQFSFSFRFVVIVGFVFLSTYLVFFVFGLSWYSGGRQGGGWARERVERVVERWRKKVREVVGESSLEGMKARPSLMCISVVRRVGANSKRLWQSSFGKERTSASRREGPRGPEKEKSEETQLYTLEPRFFIFLRPDQTSESKKG